MIGVIQPIGLMIIGDTTGVPNVTNVFFQKNTLAIWVILKGSDYQGIKQKAGRSKELRQEN